MNPVWNNVTQSVGLVGLVACAQAVPPGAGEVSKAATQRIHEEASTARLTNAVTALETADAAPGDLRASRKASELAITAISLGAADVKARVRAAAEGVLERLSGSSDACVDLPFAAKLEGAAGRLDPAANLWLRAVDACPSHTTALAAASALEVAHRCPEAISVLERAWPRAPNDAWIPILDAVASCSTSVTLRGNLAFVPESVREDYFALLRERRRAEERRIARVEAEERQRAIEERRESEAFFARSRCASHCGDAESSCMASCSGSASCASRCSALRSACLAGCQ